MKLLVHPTGGRGLDRLDDPPQHALNRRRNAQTVSFVGYRPGDRIDLGPTATHRIQQRAGTHLAGGAGGLFEAFVRIERQFDAPAFSDRYRLGDRFVG